MYFKYLEIILLCFSKSTCFSFSATSIDVEESNRSVYLNVSRTNGLDLTVSVQWETVSETAFGMSTFSVLSVNDVLATQRRLGFVIGSIVFTVHSSCIRLGTQLTELSIEAFQEVTTGN